MLVAYARTVHRLAFNNIGAAVFDIAGLVVAEEARQLRKNCCILFSASLGPPCMLMIDNYDSFTWNLVQYFAELGAEVKVVRNDEYTVPELLAMQPERVVISPGPCTPNEAGVSLASIKAFAGLVPILGVCLGHQSIGQVFGGEVVRASVPMHGKTSRSITIIKVRLLA